MAWHGVVGLDSLLIDTRLYIIDLSCGLCLGKLVKWFVLWLSNLLCRPRLPGQSW